MSYISRVEPDPDGVYRCPDCTSEFRDPGPAAFCCDPAYDPDLED